MALLLGSKPIRMMTKWTQHFQMRISTLSVLLCCFLTVSIDPCTQPGCLHACISVFLHDSAAFCFQKSETGDRMVQGKRLYWKPCNCQVSEQKSISHIVSFILVILTGWIPTKRSLVGEFLQLNSSEALLGWLGSHKLDNEPWMNICIFKALTGQSGAIWQINSVEQNRLFQTHTQKKNEKQIISCNIQTALIVCSSKWQQRTTSHRPFHFYTFGQLLSPTAPRLLALSFPPSVILPPS